MRDNVRALVQAFSVGFASPEPIVEIGSLQVDGQEGFADLRPFFPAKTYIGCDMRPGTGVDRLENVHHLTFPDATVGTVLCADTLEHVANPFLALREIQRVLRPGGLALVISTMDFPIHDYPADYWRFTPAALRLLLEGLDFILVGYEGHPRKPHTVVGVGARSTPPREVVDAFVKGTPQTTWE